MAGRAGSVTRRMVAGLVILLTAWTGSAAAQSPIINPPFNEKALFPNPAPLPAPAKPPQPLPPPTLVPDVLPPPPPAPGGERVVVIPDGAAPVPPPRRIWKGGIEFGVNGSEGNSDVFNVRLGANADRTTERNQFHLDFLYTLSNQDGVTKQNQALLNVRDEILFRGSAWSVFSATQLEYDDFRAYDLRVGTYGGLSYQWVKSDRALFKTRFGAGAVREIDTKGVAAARWVPEAVVGDDFNYRFSDRQGIVSSLDVYPNLSQIGQFRVRARAGYEIVIDPEHGMVLRLGVQDRYDSSPASAKRNDLNYFATLLFRF